jgi:hypothetical protein
MDAVADKAGIESHANRAGHGCATEEKSTYPE